MRISTLLFILLAAVEASATPIARDAVPEPLQPWIDWVLHEHRDLDCPVRHGQDVRDCIWPAELAIDAGDGGAVFRQRVTVYRQAVVRLPGDRETWPLEVTANQRPMPVVDRDSAPAVVLQPGAYEIRGRFRWDTMPDALAVGPGAGLLSYRRNDQAVRLPQIRDGKLWLRAELVDTARAPEDRVNLEVYRLLADGHPGRVVTHLALEVSGTQRELLLGRPLLPGMLALQIESRLPARLEADGQLRVQVRPGRWTIRVHARHPGDFTEMRKTAQPLPWPASEVWVFRASPGDRLVEVQGVTQIDPRQVRLPADWAQLPTYRVEDGRTLALKVIRRGDPQPEPDRLALERDIWLDFDGGGYTVRDRLSGRMTSGWRLSVDQGFELGRVAIDGKPQFITRLDDDPRHGVEVRRGELELSAESRYVTDTAELPATGWGRDFQQVGANLHLPPGWLLFAVDGVDNVPASWVQRWTLYDLFLLLIITLAVGRLWGWRWSPLALLTLLLTWHEPQAPRMVWLYLLAVIALLRVVPPESRFHRTLAIARLAGFAGLLLVALPFLVQQAREGLYPQLEYYRAAPMTTPSPAGTAQDRPSAPVAERRQIVRDALETTASLAERGGAAAKYGIPGYSRYPAIDQVAPTAKIQTGPGLPEWRWRTSRLAWNGPVASDQRIRILLLGPTAHMLINFLMIVLVPLLAWRFIDLKQGAGSWPKRALLLGLLGLFSGQSGAADYPPAEMLQELEQRLIEIPNKAPRADIESMRLTLSPDRYQATLQVHSLQPTAIPLPVDASVVTPVRVSIGQAGDPASLFRGERNGLWLLVPEGSHEVGLEVYLPPVSQLQIPLPLRPRRVETSVDGWTVEGVGDNGVPQKQLSLVRVREAAKTDELVPSVLPPFLRVERTLHLGIEWEVSTRVLRESPLGAPLSVQVPVVPGAAVTSEGVRVKEGRVLVNLGAGQRELAWRSRLDPVDALTLGAAETDQWLETWRADVAPVWHVTTAGLTPVHHQDDARNWLPTWHPWPGEQVTFAVERPLGVGGRTATIDQSHLLVSPGKRATDATLSFRLRSSQGGKRTLELPEGALLQAVKIDGRTQPIRQQGRQVTLPVVPGVQVYELDWRQMQGIGLDWRTPEITLGGESVNASLSVQAPRDRWTLWLSGPRLGPAVIFWSILAVILLVALILARAGAGRVPLGMLSWVLLGLGLTQVNVLSLFVLVGWFFLLHHRSTLTADAPKGLFNGVQLLIIGLSVVSFSILMWAVQTGLLGMPAMQIEGNGSSAYRFNWYQDRVLDAYPQATLISAPLFVYRALMMAWALWLAFSLLRWIAWGWGAFSRGGLWRSVDFTLRKPLRSAGKRGEDEATGASREDG